MRNNDLNGHSSPGHRAGAPRMARRTMILVASWLARSVNAGQRHRIRLGSHGAAHSDDGT